MTTKSLSAYSPSLGILFGLCLVVAPLYVWRFSVSFGGSELPTNFLMLFLFAVIAAGILLILIQKGWGQLKQSIISLSTPILVAIVLFGLASLVSLVAFGVTTEKLSQWVVLYLQPMMLFILIRYFVGAKQRVEPTEITLKYEQQTEPETKILKYFRITAYIIVGAAGVLALVQYFTLLTLPPDWWGNSVEPKRAIAFFAHPDAFGLFITPLLAWLIPDMVANLKIKKFLLVFLWVLGGVGILLSLSRGAWLGLLAASALYVLINANKKLILSFTAILIVIASVVLIVPNLRYRVLLPFYGEKSAVARLSLWHTGTKMIQDSPLLGKGINGFNTNWDGYNKDAGLEHYNFPHNIFLNFWVDSGLLGLLSMLGILGLSVMRGWVQRRKSTAAFGLLLFVVALSVHGLIDIPYFKNDLALVFWMILALAW